MVQDEHSGRLTQERSRTVPGKKTGKVQGGRPNITHSKLYEDQKNTGGRGKRQEITKKKSLKREELLTRKRSRSRRQQGQIKAEGKNAARSSNGAAKPLGRLILSVIEGTKKQENWNPQKVKHR